MYMILHSTALCSVGSSVPKSVDITYSVALAMSKDSAKVMLHKLRNQRQIQTFTIFGIGLLYVGLSTVTLPLL